MKKIWVLALLLPLVLTLCVTARAEAYSGTCGDSATWAFDSTTGTLTISGRGAIPNYTKSDATNPSPAPWDAYRSQITSVTIAEGITELGSRSLSNLSITELALPNSLTKIGADSLRNNTKLTSITIPDNVTEIGNFSLAGNTSLETVSFGKELTTWGTCVFENGVSVKSISISSENTHFKVVDNVLFTSDGAKLVYYPAANSATNYTVPAGVTTIGSYAIQNTTNLATLTVANDVTTLETGALRNCTSITTLTLGEKITKISSSLKTLTAVENLIYNCTSATTPSDGLFANVTQKSTSLNVIVGESVTNIPGQFCYNNVNVVSVEINGPSTTWPSTAFQKCINLKAIVLGERVTTVPGTAFQESPSLAYVKASASVLGLGDDIFGKSGESNTSSVCYDLTNVSSITLHGTNKRPFAYREGWVYVSDANTIVSQNVTSNSWIIVNGGAVDFTKTGFAAVSQLGKVAKWYEYSESATNNFGDPAPATPAANKTYIAEWIDSVYTVPATLELDAFTEGATPVGKELPITLNDGATVGEGELTAVSDSVSILASVADGKVTVTADSGLTAGNYGAVVTVTTPDGAVHKVTVTLTVNAKPSSRPTTTPSTNNTIQSPKTFDAGIAVYGMLALTSAAGAVWVTKKR